MRTWMTGYTRSIEWAKQGRNVLVPDVFQNLWLAGLRIRYGSGPSI